MPKILKVQLTAPHPNLVHQFHNFGEDVYRELRDECEVSTSEFHLRGIHKRELRSVMAKVRQIVEKKYQSLPPIEIYEVLETNSP